MANKLKPTPFSKANAKKPPPAMVKTTGKPGPMTPSIGAKKKGK